LLFYLTGYREHVEQADLMLQRELARRIVAESGTKVYGRLSVMLQYYADIRRSATVDAHLFWPHPRVDSEVLQFRFKKEPFPALESKAVFAEVVKAAFGKRRKTLQNALLASRLAVEKERLAAAFSQCGIDPQSRAETLTVRQFADLANALCF
jgi:16S rRNA (adenine1518-N6/adenine1519-N6)-dimethyltransferase